MLRKISFYCFTAFALCFASLVHAESAGANVAKLEKADINLKDKTSLQRGAKLYMNYCSGCHSLQYMRYNRMANDLGLTTHDGYVDKPLLMNNLIFTEAKVGDPIKIAMPKEDAREWFGIVPPDLSLTSRVRGADWIYTYLKSFYRDEERPYGVNNWLFPDVSMPNILANLQGEQIPFYRKEIVPYNGKVKEVEVIDYLQIVKPGIMSEHKFDQALSDLVTFLVYVGEPVQTKREFMGIWVILFLLVLLAFAYSLKKEYWKDVK